jgi:hypothetical protein
VRSTKPKKKPNKQEETPDYEPHITDRTHVVYAAIHDIEGHTYTEFTGHFPKTSRRGYKYILVLYDYDGNSIQVEPMKNRSDAEAIRAYSKIYDELTSIGLKPKFQTMDNKASTVLKQFLHSKDAQFQLVPPHFHRQNAAERAIQTFKNHFVAMLCSTDKQFPIHLWYRLIPQTVITLNLLRQFRLNPKLSAHAQLNGLFDYNKTPLAPPGTKVIIHEKTDHRGSWSSHGLNGWYVGPAMEHYRTHRVYCSTTGHERISDTVEYFPKHGKVPGILSADAATIAALDLTNDLKNPVPITPFKQPGTDRMQEIKKLAAIFESMAPKRPPVDELTEPTPKMSTQPTPRVPTPMVPTPRVQESVTPDNNPDHTHVHARRSPRGQHPPQVTQEERAYQLLATPLPRINRAYAVTDVSTGQKLEYRQRLQRPDLKPIWERAFANELRRLAQGVPDIKGTDTIVFIHAS